jgi:hypothetical protein
MNPCLQHAIREAVQRQSLAKREREFGIAD